MAIGIVPNMVQEITIGYTLNKKKTTRPQIKTSDLIQIKDAETSAGLFREAWDDIEIRESFYIMLLNRGNKCLGITKISMGCVAGTVCDPKNVFQAALKANACGIILAHNHPSGNLKPSAQDLALTQRLKEGGLFLDLPILDHIILSPDDGVYYSLINEGDF